MSDGLTRVNKTCQSLAKPTDFHFVSKNIAGNNHMYAVGYLFKADLSFDYVREFYIGWFAKNGWNEDPYYSPEGFFAYRKNNQLVFISKIGGADANYEISCKEEH